MTILQREPDDEKRDNINPVKFIQLKEPLAEIYSQAIIARPPFE